MGNAAWLRDDEDVLAVAGNAHREAAAYVASFLAFIRQRAQEGPLEVHTRAGLSPGDRRALR